jgi:hypothetical protein
MEILIKETQQVITEQEFRNLYFNTSFPPILSENILTDFGAVAILEGPQASPTSPYEYSFRDGIQEINGKYFTKYSLGPIFVDNENQTASEQELQYKTRIDEQQASSVRNTRNQLLKDSDWTQISDATVNKDIWLTYRQALRDITIQEGFPFTIVWPIQP